MLRFFLRILMVWIVGFVGNASAVITNDFKQFLQDNFTGYNKIVEVYNINDLKKDLKKNDLVFYADKIYVKKIATKKSLKDKALKLLSRKCDGFGDIGKYGFGHTVLILKFRDWSMEKLADLKFENINNVDFYIKNIITVDEMNNKLKALSNRIIYVDGLIFELFDNDKIDNIFNNLKTVKNKFTINLNTKLKSVNNSFNKLKTVGVLEITNNTNLEKIENSFTSLNKTTLKISNNNRLKELNKAFNNLKTGTVIIENNENLFKIENSFENLIKAPVGIFIRDNSLKEIKKSFGKLKYAKELSLSETKLVLNNEFNSLKSVNIITIEYLTLLNNSFNSLKEVNFLIFEGYETLKGIYNSFNSLEKVDKGFRIYHSPSLKEIKNSFKSLKYIKKVSMSWVSGNIKKIFKKYER